MELVTNSGNPSRMHLVEVDENQSQSGTPREMSHFKRTPNGENLTSASNPLGMNLSNCLPMLENPTSTKQLET